MTLPVLVHRDRTAPAVSDPVGQVERLDGYPRRWPGLAYWGTGTEVRESDDAYVVMFRLAGVKRRHIKVSVTDRRLRVSGQHKHRSGLSTRRSRRVEQFCCEVLLPGEIDEDSVRAELKDGVLTVTASKVTSERRVRIPVR